ncbi:type II toxin-antitoxin system PemK/MazF family toxin [Patescibacteria group bacterium]|nr:type II toxin-antitoxin system PemK/MazF family toxin [Patescibacteria group bacterium]
MYKKYKIILTPFPFTDLSSLKVRPAVIISNLSSDDVVVSFISSEIKKTFNQDIKIKKTEINGLKKDSVIKISKIATLDKKIILGELGEVDNSLKEKINTSLKKVFNL